MKMWSTSSSHTVNSGKSSRGAKVLFCFFPVLTAAVPSSEALAEAEAADRVDLLSVFSVVFLVEFFDLVPKMPAARALFERLALLAVVPEDLEAVERVADEDAVVDCLPSSYLAVSVPSPLSISVYSTPLSSVKRCPANFCVF